MRLPTAAFHSRDFLHSLTRKTKLETASEDHELWWSDLARLSKENPEDWRTGHGRVRERPLFFEDKSNGYPGGSVVCPPVLNELFTAALR
jgi:hypothetical protein